MRPRRAFRALITVMLAVLFQGSVPAAFAASPAAAPQAAPAAAPSDRAAELAERERAVKAEEERLLSLRKEVDAKIAKYEKLLADAEAREKRRQEEDEAKVDTLVKLFEGMTPESAAPRIEALDESMAAAILSRMKGRKAGNVLSAMEPKRAAALIRRMASGVKNFPAQ